MVSERFEDAYVPDVVPESDLEYFDRGGHGARIGWGDSPGVLVVDMTETFTHERSEEGRRAVEATADLLATARSAALPSSTPVPTRDRWPARRRYTDRSSPILQTFNK